jgi:hypothetical protein
LSKVDDDMIKKVGVRGSDQAGRDTFLRAEEDQTTGAGKDEQPVS